MQLTMIHYTCPCIDACDEFPDIPKSPPTLGIQAGHDRRDVASVRKPRPPSLSRRCQRVRYIVNAVLF